MNKADISVRVRRRLSGLRWTRQQELAIMNHIHMNTKPKHKLRLSAVIAVALLVMTLLTTAAAFMGWPPFGERVMELESWSSSGFEGWSVENKLALIEEMEKAGIDTGEFDEVIGLPSERMSEMLTLKLSEIWSGELAVASVNILEKILGPYYTWSLEEKAWYSQQLLKHGRISNEDIINELPGSDDLTVDEAKQLASQMLTDGYDHVDAAYLSQLTPYVSFYSLSARPEARNWEITFRDAYGAVKLSAVFQPDGSNPTLSRVPTPEEAKESARISSEEAEALNEKLKRLEGELGPQLYWTLQQKAEYLGDPMPGDNSISLEGALSRAKEAIAGKYNVSEELISSLRYGVYFVPYITELDKQGNYFAFTFVSGKDILYSVGVDSENGNIVIIQGPGEGNG